ncbi:MAG TPA: RidA family protein [Aestuariivirgaceae bacterium]|nr:RidA family protein [Aestuariivirgaceae bacterium]
MVRYISTPDAPEPFSRYSQAVEVAAGSRLVYVSGQVGVRMDGTLPETEEGEHEQAWANVLAILASERLGVRDIVEVTAYVTSQAGVRIYREVRERMMEGAAPASTLLVISGLADQSWHVEIQVVAAGEA